MIDRPVDQVLIEARIVIATETFARELGAKFGISGASGKPGTAVRSASAATPMHRPPTRGSRADAVMTGADTFDDHPRADEQPAGAR